MRSTAVGGAVQQVRGTVRAVLVDLDNGDEAVVDGEAVQRLRGALAVASATGELCTIGAAASSIRKAEQHLVAGEIGEARKALLLAVQQIPETACRQAAGRLR